MNLPATQLYQLLAFHSLDPAAQQVTLMRHTAGDYPVQRYVGTRALTLYQSRQDHKHPASLGTGQAMRCCSVSGG